MHPEVFVIIAAYLILTVGLGVFFGRHQSRTEFFSASGTMGWLPVGLSVMATLFSSNSFVFYPSAAFQGNLRIGLSMLAFTLMTPVIVFVFIPVFTRLKCPTAYQYLEQRFHVSVRCLASGLFVLLRIGWMASVTFAASLVVANVAAVPQTAVILTLGTVAILYTMLGGLRAVMWTDVLQFLIFATTIMVSLGLILAKSGLGVSGIIEEYFHGRQNLLIDFEPSMTLEYGSWAILIGIFLEAVSAFGADQVAVQRYLAAKSERTAKIGSWMNLAGMWLVMPGLLAIGVGLHVIFGDHRGSIQPDEALPEFVRLQFSPGMTGLFLIALLAAVMSSIDSGVHSVTTAIVVDFRDRLLPGLRPADDARDVRFIRILVLVVGALSVGLACFVGPLGNVFAIAKKTTAAFGGPLLAVFVLALFFKRAATIGVFSGALLGAGMTLGLIYRHPEWFAVWYWPIGFGLSMGIAMLVSLLTRRRDASELTWTGIMRQSHDQNPDP